MKSNLMVTILAAFALVETIAQVFSGQAANENGANIVAPGNINKIPGEIDENAPKAIEDANEIGDPHVIPDQIGDPNARAPGLIK